MASKPQLTPGQAKLGRVVGGTAIATALLATVAQYEGKSTAPYQDIVGVWTVCYGETHVAMHKYTDAQCQDMLANSLVNYAGPVLAINPELRGHPNQIVAASSLAYNIGVANYRRSTVSREFRAGYWKSACYAFIEWDKAGGRPVAGLLKRREAERKICLKGLP